MKWLLVIGGFILILVFVPTFTLIALFRLGRIIWILKLDEYGIPPDEDKFNVFMAKLSFWHGLISLMLIGLMGSLLVYYISPSKWCQYTGIGFYVLCIVFLIAFIRDIRQI